VVDPLINETGNLTKMKVKSMRYVCFCGWIVTHSGKVITDSGKHPKVITLKRNG